MASITSVHHYYILIVLLLPLNRLIKGAWFRYSNRKRIIELNVLITYMPKPAATPTAAVAHSVAAVVSPVIKAFPESRKIMPAPKKPMPVTIFETILVWSDKLGTCAFIIVNMAAPKETAA